MPLRTEFLGLIRGINVWAQGSRRAPHKPLLLLYALGRVARQRERLTPYAEITGSLRALLARYGPARRSTNTHDPFSRLCRDGLWEVPELPGEAAPRTHRELEEAKARGGFPEEQYELLRSDPELVRRAAREILAGHFPRSLHDEILDAVGIGGQTPEMSARAETHEAAKRHARGGRSPGASRQAQESRPPRDPLFRETVLDTYQRRCAVCDHDTRIGDQPLGLEAAHIKWHAAGGPDTTSNGLALCTLHHKGLDLGAVGLLPADGGYRIQISTCVNGLSESARSLRGLHGEPVRSPDRASDRPNSEFIAWHSREVFRQPSLDMGA